MYGIEAISAQNGWSMAIAGALIVMSGLTVLSLVISQLHKIAALLVRKGTADSDHKEALQTAPQDAPAPKPPACDIIEARANFTPLAAELEETFELKNLYELANSKNLPHVHLSIRCLRDSGVIVPTGDGRFAWRDG